MSPPEPLDPVDPLDPLLDEEDDEDELELPLSNPSTELTVLPMFIPLPDEPVDAGVEPGDPEAPRASARVLDDSFVTFTLRCRVVDEDASSLADSLQALVVGPFSPGGAPPGSGTQALGLAFVAPFAFQVGSVSLTPGWFGPSHE